MTFTWNYVGVEDDDFFQLRVADSEAAVVDADVTTVQGKPEHTARAGAGELVRAQVAVSRRSGLTSPRSAIRCQIAGRPASTAKGGTSHGSHRRVPRRGVQRERDRAADDRAGRRRRDRRQPVPAPGVPRLHREHELWWSSNVGSTLTATVADKKGLFQAWLAPGARIPLALEAFIVGFTAGPTTYDFDIVLTDTAFVSVEIAAELEPEDAGAEIIVGRVSMTPDEKLLVVAWCEGFLRSSYAGAGQIPSSADAAERLGWTVTKFNRKLDNVCQKLADAGTRGLHGGPGKLASGRKARLVEHALSTRMVAESDLALLD